MVNIYKIVNDIVDYQSRGALTESPLKKKPDPKLLLGDYEDDEPEEDEDTGPVGEGLGEGFLRTPEQIARYNARYQKKYRGYHRDYYHKHKDSILTRRKARRAAKKGNK